VGYADRGVDEEVANTFCEGPEKVSADRGVDEEVANTFCEGLEKVSAC